ncbi:hypothetical protein [Coleofasciculus sp. G1-WW12-02]|uniref:hypothetical protein n=1 Tax=Coleofasciculus sp. G1-WW12-02 TaxID=3068483 RepID=UPI0040640347
MCKHQDGRFYLHIQIKDTPPDPQNTDKVIGIDLGRRDIAVTSVGEKWDGKHIQSVRERKVLRQVARLSNVGIVVGMEMPTLMEPIILHLWGCL